MQDKIRIALLHLSPQLGKMAYNRIQIRKALAVAAGYSAQLAIMPELAECGCDFYKTINPYTIPFMTYPFLQNLREVALKYEMHIFFSWPERQEETDRIYNCLSHIDKEGNIKAHYRKQTVCHNEWGWELVGKGALCTEVEGLNIGLLIGEDILSKKIVDDYIRLNTDLLVCAFDSHKSLRRLESINLQCPVLICNSLLETQGEQPASLCLSPYEKGYRFTPKRPTVIIVEYFIREKRFHLINCNLLN